MSDLDRFTEAELEHLHLCAYRWGMRLFDAATRIQREMRAMTATWTPEYAELRAREAALIAAGAEQNELLAEIGAALRSARRG